MSRYLVVRKCSHLQEPVLLLEDDEGCGVRFGSLKCCPFGDMRELSRITITPKMAGDLIEELACVEERERDKGRAET